jgi:hypothetical protein
MADAPKPAPDPRPQIEKFRDAARELETDDDEAAFDERLKKLAKAPKAPAPKDRPDSGEK